MLIMSYLTLATLIDMIKEIHKQQHTPIPFEIILSVNNLWRVRVVRSPTLVMSFVYEPGEPASTTDSPNNCGGHPSK